MDYHLLCLDETIFRTLHAFPKASFLLVPVHNNVRRFCKLSLQQQYAGILGHYLLLTRGQIKKLYEVNQLAGVGFVDSRFSLYRELNRGLHLFFTNKAERVAACLRDLRETEDVHSSRW
jgi:glycerophosphoryl diester phosphodiesterase